MLDPDLERLIAAWLDGRINDDDSELLQQQLRESADVRTEFRKFAKLDAAIRGLAGGDVEPSLESDNAISAIPKPLGGSRGSRDFSRWNFGTMMWAQLAIAAAALITVGGIAYQLGKGDKPAPVVAKKSQPSVVAEKTMSGYATLRRAAGIRWAGEKSYRVGDVLPAGVLEFDEGVAEIDFFCGATVVVEGPAKMDLESDWSVRLLAGRMRANVPPAAQGFVVKAADSEIIDLGTEFALEVSSENVRVEVVDGEVKLKGGKHDGQHLLTGEGQSLMGADAGPDSFKNLSTIGDVQRREEDETRLRFQKWKEDSQQLRTDERLIAYYPIAESKSERFVPNQAASGPDRDGKIIGMVSHASGRFGSESASLGFDRPGSRVRTRVDGEFKAFTFACWVKIDSLDHLYNALFMADGYENGEPHWQLREDGRLMFSVMVDDTPGSGDGAAPGARLHHIYHTQPIWDDSMKGQWMHLASVYDPEKKQVKQYVNGEMVAGEPINPRFHVNTLRIGAAEIGNWGQPFRDSPGWVVRNLNGTIDELAIFKAALNADEIRALFDQGKPFEQ